MSEVQDEIRSGVPKVLHVDHSTAPGGAELALSRIVVVADGWLPSIAIPKPVSDSGVFHPLLKVPGIPVKHVGPAQKPGASHASVKEIMFYCFRVLGQAWALRFSRLFREATLVHANSSRAAVYTALACTLSRKPFVVHLRDRVDNASLGIVGHTLFRCVALARANGVIANSRSVLESAKISHKTLTTVIPSACGLVVSKTSHREELRVIKTIGMVARIDEWKGQDLLIRAFAAAFGDSDVRLVLAGADHFGKNNYLSELKKLTVALKVANRVDFLGHVIDVIGTIRSLDICVQYSTRPEPLGQNILQYLTCGRPVVAANAGGPSEWIVPHHNGVLVTPCNVKELSETLANVASDHRLRTTLAHNAARTPGLLTDVDVAKMHARFFSEVTHRRERIAQSGSHQ